MEVLDRLLATLFPARCVGCGRPSAALCSACLGRARRAAGLMAAAPPPPVDRWVAVFAYEGAVREALARLKYRNARSVLPVLAAALVERLRAEPLGPVDIVTWPPTTAVRRRRRGFDQAEHLARAVGRGLGVPVRPCLARRAGPSQTGRSAEERRGGPAFEPGPVAGLRVLVVDDVATTGATLASAARALRSAGAGWVGAATVARTPRRSEPPAGTAGVAAHIGQQALHKAAPAGTAGVAAHIGQQALHKAAPAGPAGAAAHIGQQALHKAAPATSGADRSPPAQGRLPQRRDQLVSRGSAVGRGPPSKERRVAMERTNHVGANRHDVIVRLRQQVADGAYQPPVDELVNRLVGVVLARRAAEVAPRADR